MVTGNKLIAEIDPLYSRSGCATAESPAAQEVAESTPEVCVESIDHWIH